jgi:predicted transcriptional regulator
MSNKEVVIEAIRKLPEEATFQEIGDEIAMLAAIRRGEEAAHEGRVVPHEEVKRKVAAWISK